MKSLVESMCRIRKFRVAGLLEDTTIERMIPPYFIFFNDVFKRVINGTIPGISFHRSVPVQMPGSTSYCPFPDARCTFALVSLYNLRRTYLFKRRAHLLKRRKRRAYLIKRLYLRKNRIKMPTKRQLLHKKHVSGRVSSMVHFSLQYRLSYFNNNLLGTLASNLQEAKELGFSMKEFSSYGASVYPYDGQIILYGMVESKVSLSLAML